MLMFTKSRITEYLRSKTADEYTAFDEMLESYINGTLKAGIEDTGLSQVSIHTDFTQQYKCIDIQSRYGMYYVEMQVEPKEFTIAWDLEEADDYTVYPLDSTKRFFTELRNAVSAIEAETPRGT